MYVKYIKSALNLTNRQVKARLKEWIGSQKKTIQLRYWLGVLCKNHYFKDVLFNYNKTNKVWMITIVRQLIIIDKYKYKNNNPDYREITLVHASKIIYHNQIDDEILDIKLCIKNNKEYLK